MQALYRFKSVTAGLDLTDSGIRVELTMKSARDALSPVVDELMLLITKSQCVPGEERDVEVALRAALENAVIHGNHEEPSKQVHISCRCEPSTGLSLVIRDEGEGFDPAYIPYATDVKDVSPGKERGIPLMRLFMDEVYYELGGTEVHMHKRSNARKGVLF